MPDNKPFTPDWCIAPAATLHEWMVDNNLNVRVLAACCVHRAERTRAEIAIQAVLDRKPLTPKHAALLAKGTGISERMWLALEHNYRGGLAAGLKDVTPADA